MASSAQGNSQVSADDLDLLLNWSCPRLEDWCANLAIKLAIPVEEVKQRLHQLRIFWVVVATCELKKGDRYGDWKLGYPIPYGPPRLLEKVWRAMVEDQDEWDFFCKAVRFPGFLRAFKVPHYPPGRYITASKARALVAKAYELGLEPDEKFWKQ